MSDNDIMTENEMREHFPGPGYASLELVCLRDKDGDSLWVREDYGWRRSEDKINGR